MEAEDRNLKIHATTNVGQKAAGIERGHDIDGSPSVNTQTGNRRSLYHNSVGWNKFIAT